MFYTVFKWLFFLGLSSNCDFAIPRLISLSDDTFLRVGLQVGDEEIGDGECMVARFCPYNYHQADILALADEDGFVNLQDTSKYGKTSIVASKYNNYAYCMHAINKN